MAFSPKTLDFLFENRLQDSREWFLSHKENYQMFLLEPMKDLVRSLTPVMLEIDDKLTTEPRVDKTICRLRRDTRYSHDKSLYRDTMWIIFKRGKMHGTEVPGIYFEITSDGFNYGCGFYHASAAYMNTMRKLILRDDPAFMKAQKAYLSQNLFQIEGELYKRPHYPQRLEEERQWLERRGISFVAESNDFNLLFSDRLSQKLEKDFLTLAPIYHFLLHAAQVERIEERDRSESF